MNKKSTALHSILVLLLITLTQVACTTHLGVGVGVGVPDHTTDHGVGPSIYIGGPID